MEPLDPQPSVLPVPTEDPQRGVAGTVDWEGALVLLAFIGFVAVTHLTAVWFVIGFALIVGLRQLQRASLNDATVMWRIARWVVFMWVLWSFAQSNWRWTGPCDECELEDPNEGYLESIEP